MALCPDIRSFMLTDHARWEMRRRGVTEAEVATVLLAPEQREEARPGRVCTSRASIWGNHQSLFAARFRGYWSASA